MKKTTAILLLVIQIMLLFFFDNLHTFMKILQEKETNISKENIILSAKYSIIKNGINVRAIKKDGKFECISVEKYFRADPFEEIINEKRYLTFDIKSNSGSVFRFRAKLDTPFSVTIRKLTKLISTFIVLVGIFLFLTGIYLIVLFKRGKKVEEAPGMPLLQDYLSKLKESETTLRGIVDKQQVNVQKSEEISKNIVNRMSAAIILLNEKGRIELFNPFAEKIFLKSSSFAINNTPDMVFKDFPEINKFFEKNINLLISSSIKSNNSIFLVEILPVSPVGNLIIIRDITEDRKKEELINSRKNFMMLGEMTIFLTHEIRNSLGVIYGYTKTLKSNSNKIVKINSEIIFLTKMMENFLNFSKPLSTAATENVDTSSIISSICEEMKITIKIKNSTQGIIKSDPNLLRSVFSNLIINAKEARATHIEVKYVKDYGKKISIEFKDNGKGIGESNIEKIWYPFFTSKSKGTGMGLAIVKKIVNFLDGEIRIVNSDKTGTKFKLTFYSST